MRWGSASAVLAVVGLLTSGALGGAAVRAPRPSESKKPPHLVAKSAGAALKMIRPKFEVFRGLRTAADVLPARYRDPDDYYPMKAAPGRSRLARVVDGYRIWAVPTNRGICLRSDNGIPNTCSASIDLLLDGYAEQSAICSPNLDDSMLQLAGLLPDGATRLRAIGKRVHIKIRVRNNVYVLTIKKKSPLPRWFTWLDKNGERQILTTSLPADSSESCNG